MSEHDVAERLAGLGGMGLGHCRMLPTNMEKQESCKHGSIQDGSIYLYLLHR